jgi:hypothetical protein
MRRSTLLEKEAAGHESSNGSDHYCFLPIERGIILWIGWHMQSWLCTYKFHIMLPQYAIYHPNTAKHCIRLTVNRAPVYMYMKWSNPIEWCQKSSSFQQIIKSPLHIFGKCREKSKYHAVRKFVKSRCNVLPNESGQTMGTNPGSEVPMGCSAWRILQCKRQQESTVIHNELAHMPQNRVPEQAYV